MADQKKRKKERDRVYIVDNLNIVDKRKQPDQNHNQNNCSISNVTLDSTPNNGGCFQRPENSRNNSRTEDNLGQYEECSVQSYPKIQKIEAQEQLPPHLQREHEDKKSQMQRQIQTNRLRYNIEQSNINIYPSEEDWQHISQSSLAIKQQDQPDISINSIRQSHLLSQMFESQSEGQLELVSMQNSKTQTSSYPLNRFGQVVAYFADGTSKKSSGTAISRSVVMTCAHSLIKSGMACRKVLFVSGHKSGPVLAQQVHVSARVKDFFRMDPQVKPNGHRGFKIPSTVDFALFKLGSLLPAGPFPELRASHPFSPEIKLYGYPNKFYQNGLRLPGGEVTRRDLQGRIKLDRASSAEGNGYLLVHDMPTENGDSGSAIVQYYENDFTQAYILGIHFQGSEEQRCKALRITQELKKKIRMFEEELQNCST